MVGERHGVGSDRCLDVARLISWLDLAEKERPTLGIITFNTQQQSLILDLLDAARRENPELEWFFSDERIEATIVKNLENVQGDERDVILFSVTFWKDAADKLTMDFGALNKDGGERRLNVAVTRARQELVVFSGFTADQIDLGRTKALGVRHLKTFLDYADRGAIALPAQDDGSVGGFDSPFEEAVAAHLQRLGWIVVPQVGISGFRIDLGIRHPERPGAYLAGVECDGASYHSSATARDRDKVREQVLKGLGWNIVRVWSTDWWFDTTGCAERLHVNLNALLDSSRMHPDEPVDAPPEHWKMGHEAAGIEAIGDVEIVEDPVEPPPPPSFLVEKKDLVSTTPLPKAGFAGNLQASDATRPRPGEGPGEASATGSYRVTDLSSFRVEPDRFYEAEYNDTLRAMVEAIVEGEAPLRSDILAQRIARAHGWLRTGGRIRERIDRLLSALDTTEESGGTFVWKAGTVRDVVAYRSAANDEGRRSINDIPIAELAAVVLEHPDLLDAPDCTRDLAHLIGVERLAATSRSRLDEAILRVRGYREPPAPEVAP